MHVLDFYSNSRLHFIGDWKYRSMQILRDLFQEQGVENSIAGAVIEFDGNCKNSSKNLFAVATDAVPPLGNIPPVDRRIAVHFDMDSFFASVAVRDREDLQLIPIAVGHGGSYGEVSSCNYPARERGVRGGMLLSRARQVCPELQLVHYDFSAYVATMKNVYHIVLQELAKLTREMNDAALQTRKVGFLRSSLEILAVDDFLVAFDNFPVETDDGSSVIDQVDRFVLNIRQRVFEETRCTLSAGIAPNVLLARMCTQVAKPNGQKSLFSSELIREFLDSQELHMIYGIGRITAKRLENHGINTCAQLRSTPLAILQSEFGPVQGASLQRTSQGMCIRKVIPTYSSGMQVTSLMPKSVSCSMNYGVRPQSFDDLSGLLRELSEQLRIKLELLSAQVSKLTLKVKKRHPEAPQEPKKHGGHGWCVDLAQSMSIVPSTSEVTAMLNTALALYKNLSCDIGDLRGLGLVATLSKRNREAMKAQGSLRSLYRPKLHISPFHTNNAIKKLKSRINDVEGKEVSVIDVERRSPISKNCEEAVKSQLGQSSLSNVSISMETPLAKPDSCITILPEQSSAAAHTFSYRVPADKYFAVFCEIHGSAPPAMDSGLFDYLQCRNYVDVVCGLKRLKKKISVVQYSEVLEYVNAWTKWRDGGTLVVPE